MFLRHLRLENIRSIDQLEMSFLNQDEQIRHWTLLLGENGTGKSTILRAIALLFSGSEAHSELLGEPDRWVRWGADKGIIEAIIVAPDGYERKVTLTIRRDEHIRGFFSQNQEVLDELDEFIQIAPHNYLTLGYGASRRLSSSHTSGVKSIDIYRSQSASSVATLFEAEATLTQLEAWAIDLHYQRGEQGIQMLRHAFQGLLRGVEFVDIDSKNRELIFRTADGEMPLSLLSEGYQNVVAWWGDLLFRVTELHPDIEDPLRAEGLLMIDEIALHLHPVWQRQLRDFLTQELKNFQIITTTHSPLTAQQAGEGELFFLTRPSSIGAPILQKYEGNPQYLKIQQVVSSPVFGLETVNSKHVEDLREDYRNLSSKSAKSDGDNAQLSNLKQQLAEIPDYAYETEREKEQKALLQRINQTLQQVSKK